MPKLHIHQDVVGDLDRVRSESAALAGRLATLIMELRADDDLLSAIGQHGFGENGDQPIDVSRWFEQQKFGRNLWRLKFLELEDKGLKYRIVYARRSNIDDYVVLAVAPRRNIDYDNPEDPLTKRIANALDRLASGD